MDVKIGTAGTGHTYPGVVAPFGMVQPSPETGYSTWRYCSGYHNDDKRILSFGQTHLSGTGCPDSGDAAFIPFTGNPVKTDYSSAFKKGNEIAEVGKYSVVLDDAKAKVEITATDRVALYRIKFLADGGGLFFDFQTGMVGKLPNRVLESDVKFVDDYTIAGTQKVRSFTRRDISFAVKFDKPVKKLVEIERPKNHKAPRWAFDFGLKAGETLCFRSSTFPQRPNKRKYFIPQSTTRSFRPTTSPTSTDATAARTGKSQRRRTPRNIIIPIFRCGIHTAR